MEIRRLTDTQVVDGDSIHCRADGPENTDRLCGISTPELEQPGGSDGADALESIINGSEPLMMEVIDVDRYGRDVGLLYPRRGHRRDSVNTRMVREGCAYAFTHFGGVQLDLRAALHDARLARRGFGKSNRAGGQRPWNDRRRIREGPVPESLLLSLLIGSKLGRIVLAILLTAPLEWRSCCRKTRLLVKAVFRP